MSETNHIRIEVLGDVHRAFDVLVNDGGNLSMRRGLSTKSVMSIKVPTQGAVMIAPAGLIELPNGVIVGEL